MRQGIRATAAAVCLIALAATVLAVPGDITFPRQDIQEIPNAVFPHWFHRIRYRCYACHPDAFPMKVTSEGNSMNDINAGRSCGICHNGRIAWAATVGSCGRCHVPAQK